MNDFEVPIGDPQEAGSQPQDAVIITIEGGCLTGIFCQGYHIPVRTAVVVIDYDNLESGDVTEDELGYTDRLTPLSLADKELQETVKRILEEE